MTPAPLHIIWSDRATSDLKNIYDWILEKSKSQETAIRVRTKIIERSKHITFPEQYQMDEVLGLPYRRMIISHYKLVYKSDSNNSIHILKVFDTLQDPQKVHETNFED